MLPVRAKKEQLLFLAWNISVSSGTNCAGAQGLALDNVTIMPTATGISEISVPAENKDVQKVFRDGQLMIIRGEEHYDITGRQMKF